MRQRALQLILIALASCLALVHTGFAAEQQARTAPSATTATAAVRATAASAPHSATLNERLQGVKRDVVQLKRDLQVLEDELLYPASSQVAVFVSVDVGKPFTLDSVQIKLDDKVVANYLYTAHELAAFQRGGVQRIFVGNLREGAHQLVATFSGVSPNERHYKRDTTLKFDKGAEAKYIQLRIEDSAAPSQPEFAVKVWQ